MRPRNRSMAPAARTAVLAACLWVVAGCTTYRIIRYREPSSTNLSMFPARTIARAPAPFKFAEGPRDNLDTLTVRAPDGTRIPWSTYMERYKVLSFVVVVNDTIVYETYREGHNAARPVITFSASKSVLSALIGIAIAEGKIRSLDDSVVRYIPALRDKPAYDGLTLRHFLDMRSGLRFTETGGGWWSDLRSDEARFYYTTNLPGTIASAKRDHAPGSRWDYKDVDAEVLGLALANAVGMPVATYLETRIWQPMGAEFEARWSLDHGNGQEFVASGLIATARDLAKFGRLFLNGGRAGDQQIVPADWVRASSSVDSSRSEPEVSNWWKMQHSFYWWHPLHPPHGDFYADGSNGERIYVDPATKTVIVQLADNSTQDFPFRRIASYFAGQPFEYPRLIPAMLRMAGLQSADSVRRAYATLSAAQTREPERYAITASGMNAVGLLLLDSARTQAAAIAVLQLTVERYPERVEGYLNLAMAYGRVADTLRAREVLDRAAMKFPDNPEVKLRKK